MTPNASLKVAEEKQHRLDEESYDRVLRAAEANLNFTVESDIRMFWLPALVLAPPEGNGTRVVNNAGKVGWSAKNKDVLYHHALKFKLGEGYAVTQKHHRHFFFWKRPYIEVSYTPPSQ